MCCLKYTWPKRYSVTCVACRRLGKSSRLPHGWKRLGEAAYCETCWRERYRLRSIALPVVEPVGEDWAAFREALKHGWTETTAAANWMMTELYARDVRRNGEEKMPPMARVYLYPEARLRFPKLASQTVVSIENLVQAAYRMARYELIWTCSASLPAFRKRSCAVLVASCARRSGKRPGPTPRANA